MSNFFKDACPHEARRNADRRGIVKAVREIREEERRQNRQHPLQSRLPRELPDDLDVEPLEQ